MQTQQFSRRLFLHYANSPQEKPTAREEEGAIFGNRLWNILALHVAACRYIVMHCGRHTRNMMRMGHRGILIMSHLMHAQTQRQMDIPTFPRILMSSTCPILVILRVPNDFSFPTTKLLRPSTLEALFAHGANAAHRTQGVNMNQRHGKHTDTPIKIDCDNSWGQAHGLSLGAQKCENIIHI